MSTKKRSLLKKVLIVLFGFVFLLVLTAAILPFVIDVDKYRPAIVRMANQRINGKLEVGKLSLSLWGRILVKIDGIKLDESNGNRFLKAAGAQLHLPVWSLIEGKPKVYFEMKSPEVWIKKAPEGRFNFQSFFKEGHVLGRVVPPPPGTKFKSKPGENPNPEPNQAQAPGASTSKRLPTNPAAPSAKTAEVLKAKKPGAVFKRPDSMDQPIPWSQRFSIISLATHARVGLRFFDMAIHYDDVASNFKTKVDGLNWEIKEISLTRPTESKIWGKLDAKLAKEMSSNGAFEVFIKLIPEFDGNQFKGAKGAIVLEASDLELQYSNLFKKSRGQKFRSEIGLIASPDEVVLSNVQAWLHEAHLTLEGKVETKEGFPVDLKFSLKPLEISKWHSLIPMLASHGLTGTVSLEGLVRGAGNSIDYNVSVKANQLSMNVPYLKQKPIISSQVELRKEKLDLVTCRVQISGSALDLNGSVTGFENPVVQMRGTSEGINLDEMIDFEALMKEDSASALDWFLPSSAFAAKQPASDYDLMLREMKKNPYFLKTTLNGDLKIRQLVAMGFRLSDIVTLFSLKNGISEFPKLDFNIYGGKIETRAKVDLRPDRPAYGFASTVHALDMETAVKENADTFKHTVFGKLNLTVQGTGRSLNPEMAKQFLDAKGSMNISDGRFTSIDVGQMATEAINRSISDLAGKIPQIKGKSIKGLPKGYSSYQKISSNYSINGARFVAPNFVAEAKPNRGIDLKGYTEFGIIDKTIKAKWTVIDRFNLLKAKDLSVKVAGIEVKQILAAGNPPVVSFPVSVTGTLDNPKYSYDEILKHLANIALKKVRKGATIGAKKKIEKKILENEKVKQAVKKAPKKVKDLIKKIFK